MKNYLVVNNDDGSDIWRTDDLNELIRDIYEFELEEKEMTEEEIKKRFFRDYEVFVSESEIVKLTKD